MKRIGFFSLLSVSVAALLLLSCNGCQSRKTAVAAEPCIQRSPDFNADSAYSFIEKQVSFGPRVPGTAAHRACGDYLAAKLTSYGAVVTEQYADMTHYDGRNLTIRNIIASFQPEAEKRILLFAHWDSRPFADEESDPERQQRPIAGADDGASGVGVLLEIARQIRQRPPQMGVDIIFFDMEDWGQPSYESHWVEGEWWCVGSRYWSEEPHVENYRAAYGILLDMVGAGGAVFPKEGYSVQYADKVVEKVWSTAAKLGYAHLFVSQRGGYITDDHLSVNQKQQIPSIDIIHLNEDTPSGFAAHWHTLADDMRNIDRTILKAVGQTVLEVMYGE